MILFARQQIRKVRKSLDTNWIGTALHYLKAFSPHVFIRPFTLFSLLLNNIEHSRTEKIKQLNLACF